MINEVDIQVVDGFYCLIMFVNFYVTVFQINNESTSNLRSFTRIWSLGRSDVNLYNKFKNIIFFTTINMALL